MIYTNVAKNKDKKAQNTEVPSGSYIYIYVYINVCMHRLKPY